MIFIIPIRIQSIDELMITDNPVYVWYTSDSFLYSFESSCNSSKALTKRATPQIDIEFIFDQQ